MPVKVNVVDNSSQVRVKPKDNEEVKVRNSCDVINKAQDARINKEIQDRIAADKNLQIQINQKQDEIEFITIYDLVGIIPSYELSLLIKNRINRLIYQDKIYYFSIKEGNIRKYFTTVQTTEYNEIDVNTNNGNYEVKSTMPPEIKRHVEDTTIHITEDERQFWNNKVTASVTYIDEEASEDYNLNLTKN